MVVSKIVIVTPEPGENHPFLIILTSGTFFYTWVEVTHCFDVMELSHGAR